MEESNDDSLKLEEGSLASALQGKKKREEEDLLQRYYIRGQKLFPDQSSGYYLGVMGVVACRVAINGILRAWNKWSDKARITALTIQVVLKLYISLSQRHHHVIRSLRKWRWAAKDSREAWLSVYHVSQLYSHAASEAWNRWRYNSNISKHQNDLCRWGVVSWLLIPVRRVKKPDYPNPKPKPKP